MLEQPLPQQLPLALEPYPHFSPDDLVIGKANGEAFALLQDWPIWPTATTVLFGAPGSGKSHMACCWTLISAAQSFSPGKLDGALLSLESGQSLLIEDILPGEFSQTNLFHLLNAVAQRRLENPTTSLLLTSRFHPSDWKIQLADLASRLKAVQLAEILPPDDGLLTAVLTKLFADRQLRVDLQLIRYCVSRMERSFEAAACFVAKLDRLALERKSKITRSLALQALIGP